MKSLVIISSFFILIQVQQITSSEENGKNTKIETKILDTKGTSRLNVDTEETDKPKTQANPANFIATGGKEKTCLPRMRSLPPYAYLRSLSARANDLKVQAVQEYFTAVEEARLLEEEMMDEVTKLQQEANKEQSKAEQKYKEILQSEEKSKKPDNVDQNKKKVDEPNKQKEGEPNKQKEGEPNKQKEGEPNKQKEGEPNETEEDEEDEEDEEALRRAEQKEMYDDMLRRSQRKRSLANIKAMKAKAAYRKALDEAAQKSDKLLQEATRIENYVNYYTSFYG